MPTQDDLEQIQEELVKQNEGEITTPEQMTSALAQMIEEGAKELTDAQLEKELTPSTPPETESAVDGLEGAEWMNPRAIVAQAQKQAEIDASQEAESASQPVETPLPIHPLEELFQVEEVPPAGLAAQAIAESAELMANRLTGFEDEVAQLLEWGENRMFALRAFVSQLASENALRWNELTPDVQRDVERHLLAQLVDPKFVRPWVRFLKLVDHEPVIRRKFVFLTLVAGMNALQTVQQDKVIDEYAAAKEEVAGSEPPAAEPDEAPPAAIERIE
jgi:hypothetical protein